MRAALADIRDLTQRDKESFENDRTAQQAVAYNLSVLGEAARALSSDIRDRHRENSCSTTRRPCSLPTSSQLRERE